MSTQIVSVVGSRMDRIPLGPFHRRLLGLIGGGMFLDGFELYLTAGVLGALVKSGWSSMAQNAAFVTSTFIGMVIGAWMAGIIGDRFGRRVTYQFNLLVFGIASLVATIVPDMQTLIAVRFVMGFGLGAEIVVGYATLTEFMPAPYRGRMIGWLVTIANSALLVATFLGMWIIPNLGWRYMFGIVGVGALIVWALRKNLPESPRWLEVHGRHDEAQKIVTQIERESGVTPAGVSPAPAVQTGPSPAVSVWTVFRPPVLGRTLMGILINIVIGFCLYGFINWLPTFLVKQGVSIASSLTWLTVMSIGAPAGAVIGLLLADKVGRKKMIVGASLWAAVFGVVFAQMGTSGAGVGLMITGFLLFVGIYVITVIGFALHVPELFGTEYRLRGTAVCSTAGRIATASVQYVVVALFAAGGLNAVLSLLVGLLVLQAIVFLIWGIETVGQSLEVIAVPQAAPGKTERVASHTGVSWPAQ